MTSPKRWIVTGLALAALLLLTGCPQGFTVTVIVRATPTSGFAPLEVAFELEASSAFELASCVLNFGDGTSAPIDIAPSGFACDGAEVHVYPTGTYGVTLVVTTTDGRSMEREEAILSGLASFRALPSRGPADLEVEFRYQGVELDVCTVDPGDGSGPVELPADTCGPADNRILEHTYTVPGTYTATLTGSTGDEEASTTRQIVVTGEVPSEAPSEPTVIPIPVDLAEAMNIPRSPLPPGRDTPLAPAALDPCPQLLVAGGSIDGGDGGGAVVDGCSGALLRGYPVPGQTGAPGWFDALILEVPATETGNDLLLRSGSGYALQLLDAAGNPDGFYQLNPPGSGPFIDAQPLGGDASAGAVMVERTRVHLLRWSDVGQTFAIDQTIAAGDLDAGGTLQPVSVAGDASGEQLLVAASSSAGTGVLLYVQNPTGGPLAVSTIGPLGSTPGRLRCDLVAGLCAVSDPTDDTVTAIVWDGASAPTIGDAATVGELPVGIDVLGLRVASAGFDDDSYSVSVFDAAGSLQSVDTQPLPAGCSRPGHAIFVGSPNNALIASCNDSGSLGYIPGAY